MPFIIGGLAAASAIMGAVGSSSSSKASGIAQQMQQDQANFQGRWQTEAQNRNTLRQWEAQYHMNRQVEQEALKTEVGQNYYARLMFNNNSSTLSKQTRQTNDAFLGNVAARGISVDSASARALIRQATEDARLNQRNLRMNLENQKRDIKTQYENMLAQRNLNAPEQITFMEQRGPIADSSSAMLLSGIASGVLGGAAAGYGAYRQFGFPSGGGTVQGFNPSNNAYTNRTSGGAVGGR